MASNKPAHNEVAPNVASGAIWNAVGSFFYLGCTWLTTVLVVVFSDSLSDSGSLAVAMAVGNILSAIILFRVRPVQVSDTSNQYRSDQYIAFRIACCFTALIACTFYSIATVSPDNYLVVALFLVFKGTECYVDVFHGIDQKHNRLDIAGISLIARGLITICCFTAGMVFFDLPMGILFMSIGTTLFVALFDYRRTSKLEPIRLTSSSFHNLGPIFRSCLPGFLSSLLITLSVSVIRQLFGLKFGNDLLGLYSAIATPCVVVQALANYVYAPFYGQLALLSSQNNKGKLRKCILIISLAIAGMTILATLLSIPAGRPLFYFLYGEKVAAYSDLLPIVIVTTGLIALFSFYIDLFIVIDQKSKGVIAATLCAISAIALSLLTLEPNINSINIATIEAALAGIIPSIFFICTSLSEKRI